MNGNLNEGERAPSVRELAVNWEINPNTVMRAYTLLAEAGVIVNRRGVGFFIAPDAAQKALAKQRHEFIAADLPRFNPKKCALWVFLLPIWKSDTWPKANRIKRQKNEIGYQTCSCGGCYVGKRMDGVFSLCWASVGKARYS